MSNMMISLLVTVLLSNEKEISGTEKYLNYGINCNSYVIIVKTRNGKGDFLCPSFGIQKIDNS